MVCAYTHYRSVSGCLYSTIVSSLFEDFHALLSTYDLELVPLPANTESEADPVNWMFPFFGPQRVSSSVPQ